MSKGKNILVTGGTGLLGTAIIKKLKSSGYEIAVLSRRAEIQGIRSFTWDYRKNYIDPRAIEFADTVIHLAAENIGNKRWTPAQKKIIMESRVKSGELLVDAIGKATRKPKKFISASAIGYYGSVTTDHIFSENDPPGKDFSAKTVVHWEKSVNPLKEMNIHLNILRIGIVLTADGGALSKLDSAVKLGAGSTLGSGKQWMPWISLNDLTRLVLFLVEENVENTIYNAVSPHHVRHEEFIKTLARVLDKPLILPGVPAFVLRMALGEKADIVLEGSRVSSQKLINAGFAFEDTDLFDTLKKTYS
jgi:uncharacterized protein (TIGR01777 family)